MIDKPVPLKNYINYINFIANFYFLIHYAWEYKNCIKKLIALNSTNVYILFLDLIFRAMNVGTTLLGNFTLLDYLHDTDSLIFSFFP